jgi:hypothetical protein
MLRLTPIALALSVMREGAADSVWSGRSASTAIAAEPQAATLSAPQG